MAYVLDFSMPVDDETRVSQRFTSQVRIREWNGSVPGKCCTMHESVSHACGMIDSPVVMIHRPLHLVRGPTSTAYECHSCAPRMFDYYLEEDLTSRSSPSASTTAGSNPLIFASSSMSLEACAFLDITEYTVRGRGVRSSGTKLVCTRANERGRQAPKRGGGARALSGLDGTRM